MSSTIEQSNGFLPLAPLRHADPTTVGLWDLDGPDGVQQPLPGSAEAARDLLLLARLHQQPLAMLHLDGAAGAERRERLLAAVWSQAGDAIVEHARACGCMAVPADADELAAALAGDGGRCAAALPARPAGRAAVIVCTVGRRAELQRSLESLTRLRCEDFEIVVVDNRPSQPGTRAAIEALDSPVPIRYVAEPRPGLAIARNTGVAAAADAEYVIFTDDDVLVDRRWLSWLLAPFGDARVQAVTGLVMPLRLSSSAEKRFELYAGFGKGVRRELYDMAEHRAIDRFLYPYWGGMFGSGNSMAFRRRALLGVGGFDPALGAGTPTAGGEDLAAFSDVILAGGRIAYEPRSLCWHEHRGDEQSLRTQVRNYGIGLTAVLWRYFRTDWRFTLTLARSLPLIVRLARRRTDDRQVERLPSDLARLEQRGRLLGPWRYWISSRRARRMLPRPAEAGRRGPSRSGAVSVAGRMPGRRRPEIDETGAVPQAGAQTRT